ncbi:MAG: 23S rRNA (adenine(2503)-C(2))-methyltransferase RlmN [Deltaproteobacteria bacterium]|nr:23S rRNA (adenine(2503)-C(2))-methyltransferase RlmN [Deltaproteobacteria bacterium]HCH61625.1 23S rRNA (adenine(2503)-C(2))-methyltransferase RlmN [Deltaproteobacteria bacterium]
MTAPTDLLSLSEADLAAWLAQRGQRSFRARQIRRWLYQKGASSVDQMSDLPRALRESLAAETALGTLRVATEQSSKDGTVKRLYRLPDGHLIESVLMRYADGRRTACISSQAGCAMGCVFCATGQMGFARHLSSTEIFEQVWRYDRALKAEGERLSNVVLMGMGEPFHNYNPVVAAMKRMNKDLGIGARHITVSTVGIVPRIKSLADEGIQVTLAVSLHAATDTARSALMPVNRKWSIETLVEACREYVEKTHRRITFEWALIEGETDSVAEAQRLGRLLSGLLCHVNVIPLNPTGGYGGQPSAPERVQRFLQTLGRYGVPASVRVRRGIDIDAGCGQLRSRVMEEQGDSHVV